MQRLQGFTEAGNTLVVITGTGAQSTAKFQGSFPGCTVTVYAAGTLNLSTIFSDNASTPTPKANPFVSGSDGTWFFYANNGRYDVKFSGGGLAAPFTLGDFLLSDAGVPSWAATTVTFSSTPTFDASQFSLFEMTLTGNVTSSTISGGVRGQGIIFRITQDGVGGRTFAWPANVQSPPTVQSAPNASTEATFYYDGTANWWPIIGPLTTSSNLSGWQDDGTLVRLITTSDKVSIGDSSINANLKFEVVGLSRIRAAALTDPTAGAGLELVYSTSGGINSSIIRSIDWDQVTNKTRPTLVQGREVAFYTHATTPGSLTERGRFASGGQFLVGTTTADAQVLVDVLGRIRAQSVAPGTPTTGKGLDLYYDPGSDTGAVIPVDWAAAVNKTQTLGLGGKRIFFQVHPTDPAALINMGSITQDVAFEFQASSTAAVAAAGRFRFRNNAGTGQISNNGGAYVDIGTGAGVTITDITSAQLDLTNFGDALSMSAGNFGMIRLINSGKWYVLIFEFGVGTTSGTSSSILIGLPASIPQVYEGPLPATTYIRGRFGSSIPPQLEIFLGGGLYIGGRNYLQLTAIDVTNNVLLPFSMSPAEDICRGQITFTTV